MSTSMLLYIFVGVAGALLGVALYEVVRRSSASAKRAQEAEQSRQMIQNAQREAENIVKEAKLEAKDLIFQSKAELEKEQMAKLSEFATGASFCDRTVIVAVATFESTVASDARNVNESAPPKFGNVCCIRWTSCSSVCRWRRSTRRS